MAGNKWRCGRLRFAILPAVVYMTLYLLVVRHMKPLVTDD